MKTKFIITLIVLLGPEMLLSPASVVGETNVNPETPFTLSNSAANYDMLKSDAPYLSEWRDLRSSLEKPTVDYTIIQPGFDLNTAFSDVVLNAKPVRDDPAPTPVEDVDDNAVIRQFTGAWSSTDSSTDGLTRGEFTKAGDSLNIRLWQDCSTKRETLECDLGTVNVAVESNPFTVTFITADAYMDITVYLQNSGNMKLDQSITFFKGGKTADRMDTFKFDYELDDDEMGPNIFIDDNTDFVTYGFPGTGTAADPYRIEDMILEWYAYPLIEVLDTDAHFVVNNVTINGNGTADAGISLNNVINFDITNSDVSDVVAGVVLNATSFGSVSTTSITGASEHGIVLSYSTDVTFDGNTVFGNTGYGFYVIDSNQNQFTNNDVYMNGFTTATPSNGFGLLSISDRQVTLDAAWGGGGFYMDPSFDNNIASNNFDENAGFGVLLEYSERNVIDSNAITNNGLTGVFFIDSHENTISNNVATGNGQSGSLAAALNSLSPMDYIAAAAWGGSGFFMDPSFDNVITGNTISNNVGDGINLELSDRTTVSDNIVSSNGLAGIRLVDTDDSVFTGNQVVSNGAGAAALITDSMSIMDKKITAAWGGSGFFMDPSFNNFIDDNVFSNNAGSGVLSWASAGATISNNQILSNANDGVTFINSTDSVISSNLVDSNGAAGSSFDLNSISSIEDLQLMAAWGGGGFFMDPSPRNVITDNIITNSAGVGVYFLDTNESLVEGNYIANSGADGIFFQDSSLNDVVKNVIENNGFTYGPAGLALDAAWGGSGFFMDPSHFNNVVNNNITNSFGDGFFSEMSTNTYFALNNVSDNGAYGVNFDSISANSVVEGNDFENNVIPGAQARDDGIANSFNANFYSEVARVDNNYDGINDNAYPIDGAASNAETTANVIPNGFNKADTNEVDFNPTKLNADSEGTPLRFNIELVDGFRALDIDPENTFLNGTDITPIEVSITGPITFQLYFDRQQVNALINQYAADNGLDGGFFVDLTVVSSMNGGDLELTATGTLEINQVGEPESGLFLVAGLSGLALTPAAGKKNNRISNFLNKFRRN